jgi:hypothetical protein
LFYGKSRSVTEAEQHCKEQFEATVRRLPLRLNDRCGSQTTAIETVALKLGLVGHCGVPAFIAPMPRPVEAFGHHLRLLPLTTVRALVESFHFRSIYIIDVWLTDGALSGGEER